MLLGNSAKIIRDVFAVQESRAHERSGMVGPISKKMAGSKFSVELSNRAKMRFGVPVRNDANLLAVRHFIRKELEKFPDLRTCDALHHLEIAIELTFIKSDDDIAREEFMNSNLVQSLVRRGGPN